MELEQQSFLRGTTTLAIEGENLRFTFRSFSRDHQYHVPLADIRPNFEKFRRVAWRWYMFGFIALGFVAFQFRSSARIDSFDALIMAIYSIFALYALSAAWIRSGRFLILKSGGEEPKTIWILRQIPSPTVVDDFVAALTTAIQQAKDAREFPASKENR